MAGQNKAAKKVAVVQGINPRQCPNSAWRYIGSTRMESVNVHWLKPTACLDCDRPRSPQGIGAVFMHGKHGEMLALWFQSVLCGAPSRPEIQPEKPPRAFRVELPGRGRPLQVTASMPRNREAPRSYAPKKQV